MDKAQKQIEAMRSGDKTGKGAVKKSQMPTPKSDDEMTMNEVSYSGENKVRFSAHTKKKGIDVSVYGPAEKAEQAKKVLDALC